MEQLKNKVAGLKPDMAFWIYSGIPVLLLILFLFVEQVGLSLGRESFGRSGLQLITGEMPGEFKLHGAVAHIKFGFGSVCALVYIVGLIGTVVIGYSKQMTNYKLAVTPIVVLFIMLSFGYNYTIAITSEKFEFSMVLPGTPIAWFEFLLGLAWVVFAYLRGNERIAIQ